MSKTALLVVIRDSKNETTTSQTIVFEYYEGAERAAAIIERAYSQQYHSGIGFPPITVKTILLPGAA